MIAHHIEVDDAHGHDFHRLSSSTNLDPYAPEIRGEEWNGICFMCEVDVTEEDMSFFARDDITTQEIQEHLSLITTDAKRQAEVHLSKLNAAERKEFANALDKELDQ